MGCPEEGSEGWFGRVDALDLVYVGRIYGGGEGAEKDGRGGKGGGDGVGVESGGVSCLSIAKKESRSILKPIKSKKYLR